MILIVIVIIITIKIVIILNNNNNNNNNNSNNNNNNNNNNDKHIVNISKFIRSSYKYCSFYCSFCTKKCFLTPSLYLLTFSVVFKKSGKLF